MPEVTVRHEIDCDEATFWDKVFFNVEFLERLFKDELKFPGFRVVDQKDDGKILTRKVRVDPPVTGLPGPVKKAMGDSLSYDEDGTFDHATKHFKYRILPSALADKSKISGEIWCEKVGDKKIARLAKMNAEVKMFMIGSMIEEKIFGDFKQSLASAAEFTNRYLREKGL